MTNVTNSAFENSLSATLTATTFDPSLIKGAYDAMHNAMSELDKADANVVATRVLHFTKVADSMRSKMKVPMKKFLEGNSRTNTARAEIAEMFLAYATDGVLGELSKNTASMYASSYWLCFEQGIPFDTNARDKKAKAGTKIKTSKGKTANIEELGKALAKALEIARALKHESALDILDIITDIDPEFVEA